MTKRVRVAGAHAAVGERLGGGCAPATPDIWLAKTPTQQAIRR